MLRLICSSEGSVNQAMSLATFLILWSGSRKSSNDSVTTVNISIYPLRLPPLFTLLNYIFSFSSYPGNSPHAGFCSHMFMSYWRPRWNLPTVIDCKEPSLLALICKEMNAGICCIISIKVIDGRQSSSSLGTIWRSRSLPSAREGVEN